jgi:hypothetical protein
MDDTMRRLADIQAIATTKARYFYFLDTKQWDRLATVFTADVDFDSAREGEYSFAGRDGFIDYVRTHLSDATTIHHGHMPIIDFDGPDEARGIWAMTDDVQIPARATRFIGHGHYHERYRREDGEWLISAWKLTRLRVDVLEGPSR